MSVLTKTCLCVLALVSFAPSRPAQKSDGPPPVSPMSDEDRARVRREIEKMRPEFDAVRVEPERVIKTVGAAKISHNFETARDKAFVTLPKVAAAPGGAIDMTAEFFFEGGAAKPLWFNVEFTVDRGAFGAGSNRTVAVESDGQRFDFGDALEREPQPENAARLVLKKSIVYASFVRALGGGNVTVHLGTFSFRLGEAERRALRDLIKLTEEGPR